MDSHPNKIVDTSRSTDYGTTYEKLNDKVGLKTVLSYLYVSPTNKRKPNGVQSLNSSWFCSINRAPNSMPPGPELMADRKAVKQCLALLSSGLPTLVNKWIVEMSL
ncbi:hypothetical protein DUI87_11529 [Hirundo rustica rustica]|uniref:Uncharacterized protein n=1 Tax=Hirundo rustica rustica TaxID=333673 RepID=A0A3M0KK72_HIRRU|nr:hypothetical protein DUI87_11529 [Hirundo rustica rustica]